MSTFITRPLLHSFILLVPCVLACADAKSTQVDADGLRREAMFGNEDAPHDVMTVSDGGPPDRLTTINAPEAFLNLYGGQAANVIFQHQSRRIVGHATASLRLLKRLSDRAGEPLANDFKLFLLPLSEARRSIAELTQNPNHLDFGWYRLQAPAIKRSWTPADPSGYVQMQKATTSLLHRFADQIPGAAALTTEWMESLDGQSRFRTKTAPMSSFMSPRPSREALIDRGADSTSPIPPFEQRLALATCQVRRSPEERLPHDLETRIDYALTPGLFLVSVQSEILINNQFVPLFSIHGAMRAIPGSHSSNGRGYWERISPRTHVVVQHADSEHLEALVKRSGELMQRAVEWQGTNSNDLMREVAMLHYVLDNSVLFARGSAAITEWVTEAIYRYHNYIPALKPNKWVSVVQAAMSTPDCAEFVAQYLDAVELRAVGALTQ